MADETKQKGKAPVDGKRLALLEAGVSALAMAMAANGIELKEGQDPLEQAIAIVKRWRELTLARAELILAVALATGTEPEAVEDPFAAAAGALETMKDRLDALDAAAANPNQEESELDHWRRRAKELEAENAELQGDVEDLVNARNVLANRLAEEDKPSALELPAEPEWTPEPTIARERPESARDVGPTYGGLTSGELQTILDAGAQLEVAFSNGEFEIIDFSGPIMVGVKELQRVDSARVRLKDGVELTGSTMLERIHGAALLLEGTQVAYHQFDPAIVIHPNQNWKLSPVFG